MAQLWGRSTGQRRTFYASAAGPAWGTLVPYLVHPTKVAIIEAMEWWAVPLSPSEPDRLFDEQFGPLSTVSYHMQALVKVGAVQKVRQHSVQRALQTFYALSASSPSLRKSRRAGD